VSKGGRMLVCASIIWSYEIQSFLLFGHVSHHPAFKADFPVRITTWPEPTVAQLARFPISHWV